MSANNLFSIILKSTFTTADFRRRLALLRQYFEKKFYTQTAVYGLAEFYKEVHVEDFDKRFLDNLSDEVYSAITKDNMYGFFGDVEKLLKNAPTIILYTSFRMPPEDRDRLGNWLRLNMPENTVVDMKIDGAAFGGCMFVWNGFLNDYSLRYHLMKHREDVGKIISSYGH